jgi:hypothetical protein
VWRRDNRHPLLPALVAHVRARYRLVAHVRARYRPPRRSEVWLPETDRRLFTASDG